MLLIDDEALLEPDKDRIPLILPNELLLNEEVERLERDTADENDTKAEPEIKPEREIELLAALLLDADTVGERLNVRIGLWEDGRVAAGEVEMVLERDPVELIALLRDDDAVNELMLDTDKVADRDSAELRDKINEDVNAAVTELMLDLDGVIVGVDVGDANLLRVCVCDMDGHEETLLETNEVGEVDCETLIAVDLDSDAEIEIEGVFDPLVDAVIVIKVEAELQPLIVSEGVALDDAVALLLLNDETLVKGDTVSLVVVVAVDVREAHLVENRVNELDALVEAELVGLADCDTDNDIRGVVLEEEQALAVADEDSEDIDVRDLPEDADTDNDFD